MAIESIHEGRGGKTDQARTDGVGRDEAAELGWGYAQIAHQLRTKRHHGDEIREVGEPDRSEQAEQPPFGE